MKLVLFVSLFSVVLSAAPYKPGSKCGLVDQTGDYDITYSRSLNVEDKEEILSLPTLTKQQIIITANARSKEFGEGTTFKNSYDAAVYLEAGRGGLEVIHAFAGKTKITEIRSYPGDNASGLLFLQGTRRVVGENSDDSVECK